MTDAPAHGDDMRRLLSVVERLRSPGGCPWDREQTLGTLKQYLLEETYELLEAIDSGDVAAHREELGDLLLQIALQAQIRAEEGAFSFGDVARDLEEKLVRRHPHVFGDTRVDGTREVLRNWDSIKAREKAGRASALDGVPRALPALLRAQRVQARAARVGFDWDRTAQVVAKVREEVAELEKALAAGDRTAVEEELGDLLFAVVNLCRFERFIAEEALTRATDKFARRFRALEAELGRRGCRAQDCSLADLDAVWEEIKRNEQPAGGGAAAASC